MLVILVTRATDVESNEVQKVLPSKDGSIEQEYRLRSKESCPGSGAV